MRKAILPGLAAAIALTVGAPRSARACGSGNYTGLVIAGIGALAIGVADLSMLLYDASSSKRPSFGYATAELMIAMPQFGLGAWGTVKLISDGDSRGALLTGLYTLATGFMLGHALWIVASTPSQVPAPESTPPPDSAVTPAPAPTLSLGPTWVPVGPLSQPGFGLVGRF
jgi:hypothetical protein